MYISLDTLYEEGLLQESLEGFREYATKIDYDAVRLHKEPYLREAFQAFLTSGGCETKKIIRSLQIRAGYMNMEHFVR